MSRIKGITCAELFEFVRDVLEVKTRLTKEEICSKSDMKPDADFEISYIPALFGMLEDKKVEDADYGKLFALFTDSVIKVIGNLEMNQVIPDVVSDIIFDLPYKVAISNVMTILSEGSSRRVYLTALLKLKYDKTLLVGDFIREFLRCVTINSDEFANSLRADVIYYYDELSATMIDKFLVQCNLKRETVKETVTPKLTSLFGCKTQEDIDRLTQQVGINEHYVLVNAGLTYLAKELLGLTVGSEYNLSPFTTTVCSLHDTMKGFFGVDKIESGDIDTITYINMICEGPAAFVQESIGKFGMLPPNEKYEKLFKVLTDALTSNGFGPFGRIHGMIMGGFGAPGYGNDLFRTPYQNPFGTPNNFPKPGFGGFGGFGTHFHQGSDGSANL